MVREIAIARRIDDVESGADHRQRRGRAGKPAAMRGGIDAEGKSADDRETAVGEFAGKGLRVGTALRGGIAAADNRKRRAVE